MQEKDRVTIRGLSYVRYTPGQGRLTGKRQFGCGIITIRNTARLEQLARASILFGETDYVQNVHKSITHNSQVRANRSYILYIYSV